jgi:hypothetical protein
VVADRGRRYHLACGFLAAERLANLTLRAAAQVRQRRGLTVLRGGRG